MAYRTYYFLGTIVIATLMAIVSGCKTDCASQSVAECQPADGCSVVEARRIISSCIKKPTAAACRDSERQICGDALTIARDRAGTEWQFPNTCIPDGWTPVQRDGDYPECE